MAARTATMQVSGIRQVMRALRQLPEKSRRKVIKSAVSKAATPVVKAAKKLIPLGSGLKPDGTPREHLRKVITKTAVKVFKNGGVAVTIGPRSRAAPHSHLVDRGTKPHNITLTKPWGKVPVGTTIRHPGAEALHFMDQAIQNAGPAAKAALEKALAKGIEKEAAKLLGGR